MEWFQQYGAWLGLAISIASCFVSILAYMSSRTANRISTEANELAAKANSISEESNEIAHRVERIHSSDRELKLTVHPELVASLNEEDRSPRPRVRVKNESSFPVNIRSIWWRYSADGDKKFAWKAAHAAVPRKYLPSRIDARSAAEFMGATDWLPQGLPLHLISACVVRTDLDEEFEAPTDGWMDSIKPRF